MKLKQLKIDLIIRYFCNVIVKSKKPLSNLIYNDYQKWKQRNKYLNVLDSSSLS